MALVAAIDVAFDFTSDTPPGRDADTFSSTLRTYNQLLWSKRLAGGELFELDASGPPPYYLHHRSKLGEFWLSSDWAVPNFLYRAASIDQIPETERDALWPRGYTIGASIVFPAQRVDGKMTLNGARAWHPKIKDRFDLTVECIRRHYLDEPSPLDNVLARYADFFGLFGDFARYVDYFHLQDLVNDDASAVRFFMPFADSPARRGPGPWMSTTGTANARSNTSSHATGGSPLTSPSIRPDRRCNHGPRRGFRRCSRMLRT